MPVVEVKERQLRELEFDGLNLENLNRCFMKESSR